MLICLSSYDTLKSVSYFDEFYFIISTCMFHFLGKCHTPYLVKFDSVVYEKNANYAKKKCQAYDTRARIFVYFIIITKMR